MLKRKLSMHIFFKNKLIISSPWRIDSFSLWSKYHVSPIKLITLLWGQVWETKLFPHVLALTGFLRSRLQHANCNKHPNSHRVQSFSCVLECDSALISPLPNLTVGKGQHDDPVGPDGWLLMWDIPPLSKQHREELAPAASGICQGGHFVPTEEEYTTLRWRVLCNNNYIWCLLNHLARFPQNLPFSCWNTIQVLMCHLLSNDYKCDCCYIFLLSFLNTFVSRFPR